MKRIFESEKEVDLLIKEYTKKSGVTIAKLLNNAVLCWFLPTASTLSVEARFLLQQAALNDLEPWVIKQSISRGITWLGKYPIENAELLRSIILHFTCSPWDSHPGEKANDHVNSMFLEIISKIKETEPDYNHTPRHPYLGNFGEDILDRWQILWNDKATYDVLSAIVYTEEPKKPFTWYEAVCILKSLEDLANEKYGIK